MRTLHATLATAAMLLSPTVALGAGAGFDVATASCSSPEVEQYIMATLPSLYGPDAKHFGVDHAVERIIFATNVGQSATGLGCKLIVRMAYKGTDLPWRGIFNIHLMPNGKLNPTWTVFGNTLSLPRLRP